MSNTNVGISLPCPCCGASEANISLYLSDREMVCHECEASFTVDDVKEFINKWSRIIPWIESMPTD